MRPDFRGFLAWVLSAHDAGVASGCAADGIGKILLASIESFDALQPRPVKDPASAISHDQEPIRTQDHSATVSLCHLQTHATATCVYGCAQILITNGVNDRPKRKQSRSSDCH
jgi:hypothetical protein